MELKNLIKIQTELRNKIVIKPYTDILENILAVDSSYSKKLDKIISVGIIYNLQQKKVIEKNYEIADVKFPYIPGFLSFREIDTTISAIEKLQNGYDIIIVDGQGIAHPRGFGFASHLGVLLQKPTIGCAKSKLIGEFEEPSINRGSYNFLYYNEKIIGAVLRTKDSVKPIFISPGNLIDIDSSIKIVLQLSEKYRLPEPIRFAHNFAEEIKRQWER